MKQVKEKVRRCARAKRDRIDPARRVRAASSILKRLCTLADYREARIVALYANVCSEVPTRTVFSELRRRGVRVVFPRVDREKGVLRFYAVERWSALRPGHFGIPEPSPSREAPVRTKVIDLFVVPGLIFDHRGHRIGYGAGYYDRLLDQIRPRGKAYGIAYDFQIRPSIPAARHDRRLDGIVTDRAYYLLPPERRRTGSGGRWSAAR